MARQIINLRPSRSPRAPQIGDIKVAASGAAPKSTPAQSRTDASSWTPNSSSRLGKKGKKLIIPIEVIRFASQMTRKVRFQEAILSQGQFL